MDSKSGVYLSQKALFIDRMIALPRERDCLTLIVFTILIRKLLV